MFTENNIPRVKKKLDLSYSRLKNASVLDEVRTNVGGADIGFTDGHFCR